MLALLQRGQRVHVIVERLDLPGPCILHHLVQPLFLGLAGEERDARLLRGEDLGRQFGQYGEAQPETWKPPIITGNPAARSAGQIHRAGELVGLHAEQADRMRARRSSRSARMMRSAARGVGLIEGVQVDRDVGAEHLAALAILGEAVQRGQRVGRDGWSGPIESDSPRHRNEGLIMTKWKVALGTDLLITYPALVSWR